MQRLCLPLSCFEKRPRVDDEARRDRVLLPFLLCPHLTLLLTTIPAVATRFPVYSGKMLTKHKCYALHCDETLQHGGNNTSTDADHSCQRFAVNVFLTSYFTFPLYRFMLLSFFFVVFSLFFGFLVELIHIFCILVVACGVLSVSAANLETYLVCTRIGLIRRYADI